MDRLDRMLSARDPAPAGSSDTTEIAQALDAIGFAIVNQPAVDAPHRPRRWSARPRRALIVAAALASLVGGAAATRTLFVNTYTHTYAPKWAIPGAGPGQILDNRGTNFRQVLAEGLRAAQAVSAGNERAHDALRRSLSTLSEQDREIVMLSAWEGLAPREIARVLGTTPNVVRIRLHRARTRLKKQLGIPEDAIPAEVSA
jgi:RNA polymerase sigma factor (sigma-70 family)